MKYLVSAILLMVVSSTVLRAQSYSGSASGNFIVYSIQSLTVTNLSGLISFDTPNDYFNGVVANNYANIKVKSNANWLVSFAANNTYFTPLSKGASSDMPATVVGIRLHEQSSFKTLSTQSQKLTDGSRGSSGNRYDFDIDVNFNPGFQYSGGLYSIGVVYTLTKQ